MNAVGCDYHIHRGAHAVRENDRGLIVILFEPHAPMAGVDDLGWESIDKHGKQICAVHTVEFNLARERWRPHGCCIGSIGSAELWIDPLGAKMEKLVAKSQPLQHAHAIGLDCDASADLGEYRRLLVKSNVHSALNDSGCRGSTTDASADDGHAKRELSHEQLVPSMAVLPLVANVAPGSPGSHHPPRALLFLERVACDRLPGPGSFPRSFPRTSSVLSTPAKSPTRLAAMSSGVANGRFFKIEHSELRQL